MKKIITPGNSGLAHLIHFIVAIGFCFILPDLIFGEYNMKSAIIMLVLLFSYSFLFHKIFLNKFNEAIKLYNKEKFSDSLNKFDEAFTYFNKYYIIDKFRFVIFLNNSKKTYRELSLLNIAYLNSEIGNEQASILAYSKVLGLYPKSFEAKFALEALNLDKQVNSNHVSNEIKIPLNKKKILFHSIISSLFILTSLSVLSDNSSSLFFQILCIFSTFFFGIALISFMINLLKTKSGLIVTHRGFLDNTSLASFKFIYWKEVNYIDYSEIGNKKFVRVSLFNFNDILKCQSFYVQLIAKLNKNRFNNAIQISADYLNCSLPELKNVLQNGRKRKNNA